MAFEIEQHRLARATAGALPPAPVRHRNGKPGQQHVVDAPMKRRSNPRQQRLRHLRRQRQRQMPGRAGHIAHRIKPVARQQQRRLAEFAAPERKLIDNTAILRLRRKVLGPAPE